MNYDNLKIEKVKNIRLHVEDNSKIIDTVVDDIIQPYCKDLDAYVEFIRGCLQDGQSVPTDEELDDFCMNLSTLIYFASGASERLGIRDDISKAVWKEVYNSKRNDLGKGTVADKDSIAELESQQEYITNVCYARAYKVMKAKVGAAQELLQSCKKVLSRRLTEMELTRIGGK